VFFSVHKSSCTRNNQLKSIKNVSLPTLNEEVDMHANPPVDIAQLINSAHALAGFTLGEIAAQLQIKLPADLTRDKGTVGQLLELALGASSGSKAEPDFPHLGIELKTLPIDANGKPLESTYVCVAPLTDVSGQQWETSWVCRKLQHVLWVPIWAERRLALADRVIGQAFLWQPDAEQQQLLQQDWEELMELIVLGGIDQIRGAHGKALQLRPKAANSKALTSAVGSQGQPIQTLPRGFYLKTSFTHSILQRQFGSNQ
jgi:DNA mismatch repair protein MutH